jgi:PKD repeat protein
MNRKVLTCGCVFGVVVFAGGKSFACSCQNPVASMSVAPSVYDPASDKFYVRVGESIAFMASGSYDPDWEVGDCEDTLNGIRKFEWDWTNDGTYDASDEPGNGIAAHTYSTTGSYTVKLRVHDDDDDCCCSGAGCADKTATLTVDIVVFRLEITSAPVTLLAYINEYAGTQPTKTATAEAEPSGGAYSWEWSGGGGAIEFVGEQNAQTVTIRGTWFGNVTLKVIYTLGGVGLEDSVIIKVQRISRTTCTAGELDDSDPDRYTRYFYHTLLDQDGVVIDVTGVPVKEYVYDMEGNYLGSTATVTGNQPEDGDWTGGICAKDHLSYPTSLGQNQRDQSLKAGGWGTNPWYYLWFEMGSEDVIWKQNH